MSSRYLVVEDHPLFAEALLVILRGTKGCEHVSHVRTIADAKTAISEHEPFDLILLDLRLPDSHGFDGLIDLRIRYPKLPVVVVSAFAGQSVKDKAIVFGASAFIAKSASRAAFRGVLDYICSRSTAEPDAREALYDPCVLTPATSRHRPLTSQQMRVLHAICDGLQNKKIALDLDIAETTVKAHVSEILRKLHVTSRTQAVLEVAKLEASASMTVAPWPAPASRSVSELV